MEGFLLEATHDVGGCHGGWWWTHGYPIHLYIQLAVEAKLWGSLGCRKVWYCHQHFFQLRSWIVSPAMTLVMMKLMLKLMYRLRIVFILHIACVK
jgi:hypothetical protein